MLNEKWIKWEIPAGLPRRVEIRREMMSEETAGRLQGLTVFQMVLPENDYLSGNDHGPFFMELPLTPSAREDIFAVVKEKLVCNTPSGELYVRSSVPPPVTRVRRNLNTAEVKIAQQICRDEFNLAQQWVARRLCHRSRKLRVGA